MPSAVIVMRRLSMSISSTEFPVSWISSCPQLPPIRQMLRELHPQIRCLEDLEHAMPHAPVPRETTTETSSEPASSVAGEPADDDYVSDESCTTDCTHPRVVTPLEALSQHDFDIQLFSGERFTCRVESQEARSEWIQALEVARSSSIPDCPLYDPLKGVDAGKRIDREVVR